MEPIQGMLPDMTIALNKLNFQFSYYLLKHFALLLQKHFRQHNVNLICDFLLVGVFIELIDESSRSLLPRTNSPKSNVLKTEPQKAQGRCPFGSSHNFNCSYGHKYGYFVIITIINCEKMWPRRLQLQSQCSCRDYQNHNCRPTI